MLYVRFYGYFNIKVEAFCLERNINTTWVCQQGLPADSNKEIQ